MNDLQEILDWSWWVFCGTFDIPVTMDMLWTVPEPWPTIGEY